MRVTAPRSVLAGACRVCITEQQSKRSTHLEPARLRPHQLTRKSCLVTWLPCKAPIIIGKGVQRRSAAALVSIISNRASTEPRLGVQSSNPNRHAEVSARSMPALNFRNSRPRLLLRCRRICRLSLGCLNHELCVGHQKAVHFTAVRAPHRQNPQTVSLVGLLIDDDTAINLSASSRAKIPEHVALPFCVFSNCEQSQLNDGAQ